MADEVEETLRIIERDGEAAGLAHAMVALDGMPLAARRDHLVLLALAPAPAALDWLEARIESPVVEWWGIAAALVGIGWARIAAWMERGRPHSLAALDALIAYARPRRNRSPLEREVQPVLVDPPSRDELQRATAALAVRDPVHRVTITVDEIHRRAGEILRGGPSDGLSVRELYARLVATEQAHRDPGSVKHRQSAEAGETEVRPAVLALVDRGPFPSEPELTDDALRSLRAMIDCIERPLTRAEAAALLACFGTDDALGLAWKLVHLIEATPGGIPLDEEPPDDARAWVRFLWNRSQRWSD